MFPKDILMRIVGIYKVRDMIHLRLVCKEFAFLLKDLIDFEAMHIYNKMEGVEIEKLIDLFREDLFDIKIEEDKYLITNKNEEPLLIKSRNGKKYSCHEHFLMAFVFVNDYTIRVSSTTLNNWLVAEGFLFDNIMLSIIGLKSKFLVKDYKACRHFAPLLFEVGLVRKEDENSYPGATIMAPNMG